VSDVEAQQELNAIVPRQLDVASAPQLVPRSLVALERLGEPGIAAADSPALPSVSLMARSREV
jgi:hypothetical protein